jgi:ATP-dependent Lon protease
MSPMSPESTVVRNYLDWLLSIPWNKKTKVKRDLKAAQEILDNDHVGLEKVKERIVEYLAVQQRANKLTGPILCLVDPAGVGKTSLGKSIARATGRDFVRFSLGGVHDEAEILSVLPGAPPGLDQPHNRTVACVTAWAAVTRSVRRTRSSGVGHSL